MITAECRTFEGTQIDYEEGLLKLYAKSGDFCWTELNGAPIIPHPELALALGNVISSLFLPQAYLGMPKPILIGAG